MFSFLTKKKTGKKKLEMSYNEVESFLSNIPDINNGGCGIAALALYDAAVAEGKRPKIYYTYSSINNFSYEVNQKYIKGKIKEAQACSHIVIKLGKNYYDSKGEYDMYREAHVVTREHLVNSIKHGCWNPSFDRSTYLPRINSLMGYNILIGLN